MKRTTTLIIIALAVILLAVAFLLLDFRLASSSTSIQANKTSGRSGSDVQPPVTLRVFVWIEEKDSLSTQLRDQLIVELGRAGRFSPVLLPTATPQPGDFPLLRVWIQRPGFSWTPVYAQADMLVRYGFSSYSDDISFQDNPKKPILLNAPKGTYGLYVDGNFTLKDTTFGLVSLPGYWRLLASQAAGKIAQELNASFQ